MSPVLYFSPEVYSFMFRVFYISGLFFLIHLIDISSVTYLPGCVLAKARVVKSNYLNPGLAVSYTYVTLSK